MVFSYYPGCTLKAKAKDLDMGARLAAEKLGIVMEEIPEWQCCGGVYPMGKNEIATKLSSVRALVAARDKGQDLLTLCSACHHVLKRVNKDMAEDEQISNAANSYMQLENPYAGETKVIHYLEMLRDVVGFDKLAEAVTNPLTGRKIGAYYGCLLLRPSNMKASTRSAMSTPTIALVMPAGIASTTVIITMNAAPTRAMRRKAIM